LTADDEERRNRERDHREVQQERRPHEAQWPIPSGRAPQSGGAERRALAGLQRRGQDCPSPHPQTELMRRVPSGAHFQLPTSNSQAVLRLNGRWELGTWKFTPRQNSYRNANCMQRPACASQVASVPS
jgi:hypothetical protein